MGSESAIDKASGKSISELRGLLLDAECVFAANEVGVGKVNDREAGVGVLGVKGGATAGTRGGGGCCRAGSIDGSIVCAAGVRDIPKKLPDIGKLYAGSIEEDESEAFRSRRSVSPWIFCG